MIRKIVISTGVVTTLAGSTSYGSTDATGIAARFNSPFGITTDGTNLYVTEHGNDKIRKISLSGNVNAGVVLHNLDDEIDVTVNLASSDTGEATVSPATLTFTEGNWNTDQTVTVTGVNDTDSDRHQAYQISLSSELPGIDHEKENPEVTTLAGSGTPTFADGNGTAASFNYPKGITGDGTYLYVADSSNRRLRRIEIATGEVTTIAGTGSNNCVDSATGTSAKISKPEGLTTDGTNIYLQTCQKVLKYNISSTAETTMPMVNSSSRNDMVALASREALLLKRCPW